MHPKASDKMSNPGSSSALKEAESRHRQILNSVTSFAIVVTDLDGLITAWNEGARRILGWSEEEMLGQKAHRFFTPEDIEQRRPETEMKCALQQGYSPDERWHVRKNGERFWASGEMNPLRDEAGRAVGFVKILRDRTERMQAAAELARLKETLEMRVAERTRERDRLWRNSLDLLVVIGPDGRFRSINPAWKKILGYDEHELVGQAVEAYVHPDDVELTRAAVQQAFTKPLVNFEVRSLAKDGSYRWTAWTAASEEGVIYANGRDVTQEKNQAQLIARTNAARLQLALAVGEMGVWEWDVQADRVRWLEGAAALHGYSPIEAPAGFPMQEYERFVHPEDRCRLRSVIEDALGGGKGHRLEYRTVWPDGSVHWLEARGEVFKDESGRPVLMAGVSVDVTRRKRTERNLEFIAQVSAELARLVDPPSTLQKLAELAVPSFADWCAVYMLDDDVRLRQIALTHAEPQPRRRALDELQRVVPSPNAVCLVWDAVQRERADWAPEVSREVLDAKVPSRGHQDLMQELGFRSYIVVPISVTGKTFGAVMFVAGASGRSYDERDLAVAEDVARRTAIAIENARLYEALQKTDRHKDVFLATLAHELRNPLAAIANAIKILEIGGGDSRRAASAQRLIARQVGQLSHLVDDLMDISRITTGKIELRKVATDLAGILTGAIETCRAEMEAGQHRLSVRLPEEPTDLLADPTRLTQVFANLLSNAAKYTPPGGHIELVLECTPEEFVVRVKDTGVGIPPERLQDVFKMFMQVTHPLERSQGGLGIGLALVDGLVRLHGGRAEACSQGMGQGSEFRIYLPRPAPETVRMASEGAPSGPGFGKPGRQRRILVVDDNADAANALAELLGLLGHEVVGILHDGAAAVDAALELQPDFVLLDIGLPDMSGYEVARRIRARKAAHCPVLIAVTGWGMDSDKEKAFAAGFDHHWVKPLSMEQLLELSQRRWNRPA